MKPIANENARANRNGIPACQKSRPAHPRPLTKTTRPLAQLVPDNDAHTPLPAAVEEALSGYGCFAMFMVECRETHKVV